MNINLTDDDVIWTIKFSNRQILQFHARVAVRFNLQTVNNEAALRLMQTCNSRQRWNEEQNTRPVEILSLHIATILARHANLI